MNRHSIFNYLVIIVLTLVLLPSITAGQQATDMEAVEAALVGTWIGRNTVLKLDLVYVLNTDGTYTYTLTADITPSSKLSILERGTYRVQAKTLTFTPISKIYRRDVVDEGDDDLKVRSFKWQIKPSGIPGKRNLLMSAFDGASVDVFTQQ